MKITILSLFISLICCSCVTSGMRDIANDKNKKNQGETYVSQSYDFFEKVTITNPSNLQRMGMLLEAPGTDFKGCVIYLEGFGDSVLNHYPLFNKLRNNGYRVLGFDYLGQGGSQGSMNDMSIGLIAEQAQKVWDYYSKTNDSIYNRSCKNSKKRVIAWSTGGLAAYQMAHEKWGDSYVLINPAIAPRWCIGETMDFCLDNIGTKDIVTFRTLTRNTFDEYTNPHLEPVKPTNPLNSPLFLAGMLAVATQSQFWKIDASQKMLFLLSGPYDAYVNTETITSVIDHNVGWYRMFPYTQAYHELDNELPEVSDDVHRRVLDFLNDH